MIILIDAALILGLGLIMAIVGYILAGWTWAAWAGLSGLLASALAVALPEIIWRDEQS